jgi:phospholipid transport system substrate-binding protein
MTQKLSNSLFWLWIALFTASTPSVLFAGGPTEEVQKTVDRAVAVLKNPSLKSEGKKKERRDQIRQVLLPRFDFAEMARRSLGAHWRQRTPEEQREFVALFSDLLERAYIERVEGFNDEKFTYTRERQDRDYAEVDTKIQTPKGEEFSINYKLHLADQSWKVYDVVIENISLVNNYRDQFNRVIANSSYEELIRKIKEKSNNPSAGGK